MIKVLFVCHGNICRSPMAEYLLKAMVEKNGIADQFFIASAATSTEEIGNPVHAGTQRVLRSIGISCEGKRAVQIRKYDYNSYDYIIGMEKVNVKNILKAVGSDPEGKVYRLLDFTDKPRDIDDPWYTGKFDDTYKEIYEGCIAFLKHLRMQGMI